MKMSVEAELQITNPKGERTDALAVEQRKYKDRFLKDLNEWMDSREFDAGTVVKRIPARATDPDSVWRDQMQNARATMRQANLPGYR